MDWSIPGFPVHHQLPELAQTHVHWVSDAIQPSHPLLYPSSSHLQSFPASGSFLMSQLFTSGDKSIGASASASVLPMNIQDLFPFRIEWFALLAAQVTLKSSPTKASALWYSAFIMVHLSHPCMTTGKPWLDGPSLAKWYLCFLICCLGLS